MSELAITQTIPGDPDHIYYAQEHYYLGAPAANELHAVFQATTRKLALEDQLILSPGRTKPPKSLSRYGLIPVLPEEPILLMDSLSELDTIPGKSTYPLLSDEYAFESQNPGQQPCMDSRLGVGLTYDKRVVALAAGGLTIDGAMITQIQDISLPIQPGQDPQKHRFSSGLHSGFEWRASLTSAWRTVMKTVVSQQFPDLAAKPVMLQSARNNFWASDVEHTADGKEIIIHGSDPQRFKHFQKGYDKVAESLGGYPQDEWGDYILPDQLTPNA